MLGGIRIARVNLDGQVVGGVEDLDQQGESVVIETAEQLGTLIPCLREEHAGKRARGDLAIPVRMGGNAPALPHRAVRDLVAVHLLELTASPDLAVEDRLHEQQVG